MTLYTSDNISRNQRRTLGSALRYLVIACCVGIAGGIYEIFSHGVYSAYMIYAFAFPLLLGTLPNLLLGIYRPGKQLSVLSRDLWGAGIAAITTGSVFQGILAIYGTSSNLAVVYPVAGVLLLVSGLAVCVFGSRNGI